VFYLLFTNWLLFSVTVNGDDGETIVIADSIKNMMKSPAFQDLSRALNELYEHVRVAGFSQLWSELLKQLDADGVGNSFAVLGLDAKKENEYKIADIKKAHRKLALQWHPDKQSGKSDTEVKAAEEKFREIQEAYEKLQKLYKRRS